MIRLRVSISGLAAAAVLALSLPLAAVPMSGAFAQTSGAPTYNARQVNALMIGRFMACAGSFGHDMDKFHADVLTMYEKRGYQEAERKELDALVRQGHETGEKNPKKNPFCQGMNKDLIGNRMERITNPVN